MAHGLRSANSLEHCRKLSSASLLFALPEPYAEFLKVPGTFFGRNSQKIIAPGVILLMD
jgi:hypothetical protein